VFTRQGKIQPPPPAQSMLKRILKVLGVIVVALAVAAGSVAAYASRTWDKGRYASYPLPDLRASADSAIIARGRYLAFGPAHCVDCHTPPGGATLSGGVRFGLPLGDIYSPNITPDPTTGIARYSDGEIARMLRYNVRPHGRAAAPFMQFERMSDDDVVAIISYLRSNRPVTHAVPNHQLNLMGKTVMTFVIKPNPLDNKAPKASPATAPTVERGEYLVNSVAECAGCHTLRNLRTGAFIGPPLGGGFEFPSDVDPTMVFTPPNLTSDPTGITGRLSEDQFVARFHQGSVIKESIMPWKAFTTMHDDDIRAIYRYIKTVPAVRNEVVTVKRKPTAD
jgi:mono/diheme cytochrome c family protein